MTMETELIGIVPKCSATNVSAIIKCVFVHV